MTPGEKARLSALNDAELYKAGFQDGFNEAKGKKIPWDKLIKKCAKAFNKRLHGINDGTKNNKS